MASEIHWHEASVRPDERYARHLHRGATAWLTGLSGSGKSNIASAVCRALFDEGMEVIVLDADNVRHGLNVDLGFTNEDRTENVRRLSEVAALMASFGFVVLVTAISPFRRDRDRARAVHENQKIPFIEVHVATSLVECEARDPKGLYARFRAGEFSGLSGVDAPYEVPLDAEIVMVTDGLEISVCAMSLAEKIKEHVII